MQGALHVAKALREGADDSLALWFKWNEESSWVNISYYREGRDKEQERPLHIPFPDCQVTWGDASDPLRYTSRLFSSSQLWLPTPPPRLDPPTIAHLWLQSVINYQLGLSVNVVLAETDDKGEGGALAPQIMPRNLAGAVWLQFATGLRGAEWRRQCPQCDDWFHVHANARRANTTYCSTRCRVRASRQRQARATLGV
jgi:hypothetical protein